MADIDVTIYISPKTLTDLTVWYEVNGEFHQYALISFTFSGDYLMHDNIWVPDGTKFYIKSSGYIAQTVTVDDSDEDEVEDIYVTLDAESNPTSTLSDGNNNYSIKDINSRYNIEYLKSFKQNKLESSSTHLTIYNYDDDDSIIGLSNVAFTNPSSQTISGTNTFSGTIKVPTVATTDDSTKAASTAFVKAQGYITGISSSDVTTALGYTPLQSSDISNMVTTNTAQTITSEKTFLSQIVGTMHSYSATNSSVNTSPYKKIAECVLTGSYQTVVIPFVYSRTSTNVSESTYLGKVMLRVSGTAGNVSSSESGVILADYPDGVRNGDIKFFILYKNNTPEANKATCQLWVYISGTYTGINVIPLRQGIGGSSYSTTNVTWGNNITEAAELPSDYTAIAQKFADYNPFGIWYGTSSSNADTTEKVVILPVYTSTLSLNAGQCLIVKPTTTSTVANSTIKLVASDGTTVLNTAKTMKYNNANITTSTDSIVWRANTPSIFVYDGTYWVFAGHGYDENTTYSAMSVSEGTTGTATSSRVMRADYLKQIIEELAISKTNTYYDSTSSTLYIG